MVPLLQNDRPEAAEVKITLSQRISQNIGILLLYFPLTSYHSSQASPMKIIIKKTVTKWASMFAGEKAYMVLTFLFWQMRCPHELPSPRLTAQLVAEGELQRKRFVTFTQDNFVSVSQFHPDAGNALSFLTHEALGSARIRAQLSRQDDGISSCSLLRGDASGIASVLRADSCQLCTAPCTSCSTAALTDPPSV